MLVAGVNIIEHMPRFCNWNSIMTAFDDVEIDGLHKGFDSAVFKYNCLFACFMNHVIKKRNIAWSLGFDNYYKNTISDHVRVPKFWCT